jgi:hypothetical protein
LKFIFSFIAIFIWSILHSIASEGLTKASMKNIQAYIPLSQNIQFFVAISVYVESKHQFQFYIYLFIFMYLFICFWYLKYYTASNTIYYNSTGCTLGLDGFLQYWLFLFTSVDIWGLSLSRIVEHLQIENIFYSSKEYVIFSSS